MDVCFECGDAFRHYLGVVRIVLAGRHDNYTRSAVYLHSSIFQYVADRPLIYGWPCEALCCTQRNREVRRPSGLGGPV